MPLCDKSFLCLATSSKVPCANEDNHSPRLDLNTKLSVQADHAVANMDFVSALLVSPLTHTLHDIQRGN